jgi:hypothetical protein
MKALAWVLLPAFALLFLMKGVVPAFSQAGTDYANYYTSSWIAVHDRAESFRLYDQSWFSEKAKELGEPLGGIFQPFPPPTALLMIPLTAIPMMAAKDFWTVCNILLAAALLVILSNLDRETWTVSALVLFGSGWALVNTVYLGQVYLLMLCCLALSMHFRALGRDVVSGIFAGVFIPIKYFPITLVVLFVLERRWKAVGSALVSAAVISLGSVAFLGWEVHAHFLQSVFASHLDGQMSNPFAVVYQSWNSLLRNLFVKDQFLNPDPPFNWNDGFAIARWVIALAIVSGFFVAVRREILNARRTGMLVALLFVTTLLLSPASASYHMLLLALPASLLLPELQHDMNKNALTVLAASYFTMGIVPIALLDQLSLHGGWIVLGYPRLYLLLIMFVTLVRLTSNRRPQTLPLTA